jgi:hypothetical protein
MSDKPKTRVQYEVEKSWDGKAWKVTTHAFMPAESAAEAVAMVMSFYKLEDPEDVEVDVRIKGNEALDILFRMER